MKRLSIALILSAGCASTPLGPRAQDAAAHASAAPLPDVQLTTLAEQPVALRVALKSRPALLSLWATWCETCLTELGALGRLSTQVESKGGYVVAISEGEPLADVKAFVQRKALAYPQLVDEKFALSDAIGARTVPTTLVVDRAGIIVFRGGALDEAALRAFDQALQQ